MDTAFWHARWETGQIGFHQDEIHVALQDFWPQLHLPGDEQVFVPLCGKSLDMLWLLEQGHHVLGVELSPIAVAAFFQENGLVPESTQADAFTAWRFGEVKLLCGDFFDLRPAHLTQTRAVYDRASLVALPPEMRQRYAAHLAGLLAPATPVLLITLEYPQTEMNGPPFSVTETEVRDLYGAYFTIEKLDEKDVLEEEAHFRDKGLTRLRECAYLLR